MSRPDSSFRGGILSLCLLRPTERNKQYEARDDERANPVVPHDPLLKIRAVAQSPPTARRSVLFGRRIEEISRTSTGETGILQIVQEVVGSSA